MNKECSWVGLDWGIKVNSPHVGPGIAGVFRGDLYNGSHLPGFAVVFSETLEKPQKTHNG